MISFLNSEQIKEAKLLDSTQYLPLEYGKDKWAHEILKRGGEKRENGYLVLSESKYSIGGEAKRLLAKYEELMNREKI